MLEEMVYNKFLAKSFLIEAPYDDNIINTLLLKLILDERN